MYQAGFKMVTRKGGKIVYKRTIPFVPLPPLKSLGTILDFTVVKIVSSSWKRRRKKVQPSYLSNEKYR